MLIHNEATAREFATAWITEASPRRAFRYIVNALESLRGSVSLDRAYGRTDRELLSAVTYLETAARELADRGVVAL